MDSLITLYMIFEKRLDFYDFSRKRVKNIEYDDLKRKWRILTEGTPLETS